MSKLPESPMTLTRYLRQQARTAQRQQQSSAFARSGTSVSEDVVTVDGELDVTGAMVVGGTLSLPAGIIDNVALANPVMPQSVNFHTMGNGLTTSYAVKTTQTITVPAGFTTAMVTVVARYFCINPNTTGGADGAGMDNVYAYAQIDTIMGSAHALGILGGGNVGINVDGLSTVLTSLTPGGTFTIVVNAATQYQNWAANASNAAEISGTILWLR